MYRRNSSGPKKPCANPVFENWILEWRQDAIARDLPSKHNFTKSLNALRKYPIPLNSGKECIILEGFGDKICKQIDEKLKSFLDEGGILHEPDDSIILDSDTETDDDSALIDITPVNSKKQATKTTSNITSESRDTVNILAGESASALVDKHKARVFSFTPSSAKPKKQQQQMTVAASSTVSSESQKPKIARKGNKKYLPEPRTGPYAILITLYNNEMENENRSEEGPVYMLKAQLINEAQPHCNTSFVPDRNSHFTAWNSMSGLIKKGLVHKTNNLPAKYMLTEPGRHLASKLLYGTRTGDSESDSSEPVESGNKIQKFDDYREGEDSPIRSLSPLAYKQVDEIMTTTAAKTTYRSDLIGIESDSNSDDIITLVDDARAPMSVDKNAYNRKQKEDSDADDIITIDNDGSLKNAKRKFVSKHFGSDSEDDLPDIGFSAGDFNAQCNKPKTIMEKPSFKRYDSGTNALSEKMLGLRARSFDEDEPTLKPASSSSTKSSAASQSSGFDPSKFMTKNTQSTNKRHGDSATTSVSATNSMTPISTSNTTTTLGGHKPKAMFKYEPGCYDVVLFVDNCEQTAKKQDILIDELRKSGIKFDIGKLHVGDFTWIARPKSKSSASDKDVILNCVLERKRMDDFCSSILDGRYKEQKFRLKKCGITKQIYLIEDHGSMKHMSLPEKSLVQADVNTQLIDHLLVHHSTDPKDTAHYLIELTNYMTRAHRGVAINVCLKDDLDLLTKSVENDLVVNYYMTLKEFNAFSNKNKPMSLKEMFAKCLMKIQGFSQEKCLAVIETFPTIDSLMIEYAKCPAAKREKMLANLKFGRQQKNLGPALSKVIAQLFYSETSLN